MWSVSREGQAANGALAGLLREKSKGKLLHLNGPTGSFAVKQSRIRFQTNRSNLSATRCRQSSEVRSAWLPPDSFVQRRAAGPALPPMISFFTCHSPRSKKPERSRSDPAQPVHTILARPPHRPQTYPRSRPCAQVSFFFGVPRGLSGAAGFGPETGFGTGEGFESSGRASSIRPRTYFPSGICPANLRSSAFSASVTLMWPCLYSCPA